MTKNSLKTGQMAAMKHCFRVSVREILASEAFSKGENARLGCLSTGRLLSPLPVILGRIILKPLFLSIFVRVLLRMSENTLIMCGKRYENKHFFDRLQKHKAKKYHIHSQ